MRQGRTIGIALAVAMLSGIVMSVAAHATYWNIESASSVLAVTVAIPFFTAITIIRMVLRVHPSWMRSILYVIGTTSFRGRAK